MRLFVFTFLAMALPTAQASDFTYTEIDNQTGTENGGTFTYSEISTATHVDTAPAPAEPIQQPAYIYTAAQFNFRFKPNGKIIQMLPTGTKLEMLGREGDWFRAFYDGEVGYIHKSGVTHPDLDRLPYVGNLADLNKYERIELAACVSALNTNVLNAELYAYVESIRQLMVENSHSEAVTALINEARKSAAKCRSFAPHACKRMGEAHPCGINCNRHQSKGWCKAGVREAVEKALGFTLPGGSALESERHIASKMRHLKSVTSCEEAPVGAICVYEASHHDFGHVEIKSGKDEYCSDFCAARPVRELYTFRGAYIP